MSQIAATHRHGGWAVFLDVDGTILEIAETPQDVYVPESLKILLNALCLRLDGALALISGRTIADLDRLFAPFRFCVAGVHGSEHREPAGNITRGRIEASTLDGVRQKLFSMMDQFPGLLLEDKQIALAMHFRRVPHMWSSVCERMAELAAELAPEFVLQPGRCVLEIRPAAWTKATAIERFMKTPPFLGCTPIFIGDDLTDEEGFAWVNRRDGLSIRVGAALHTTAEYAFADVTETHTWLRSIPPVLPSRLRRLAKATPPEQREDP